MLSKRFCGTLSKIVSEYDQECHNHKLQTNQWHREEEPHNKYETLGKQTKQSNQFSLPHQDDCKTVLLEWTQSNEQQNIEKLQNPTMGEAINNESTTSEPPPQNGKQPKPPGGLNAFYWYEIFALYSAVVEAQTCLARMEASQLLQCIIKAFLKIKVDYIHISI